MKDRHFKWLGDVRALLASANKIAEKELPRSGVIGNPMEGVSSVSISAWRACN